MSTKIQLQQGDITQLQVDAIVNAANTSLMGGSGVDGAIHRTGGPQILEECRKIIARQGSCPTGEAVITTAGNLPAKFVIHTVGPVWNGGHQNESLLLANAYKNSLKLTLTNHIETIAFPNISTGIYRFPKQLAAQIAIKEVQEFLNQPNQLKKIIFICFDEENHQIYQQELENHNI